MILNALLARAPSLHLTCHGHGAALQGWQRPLYTTDDFPVEFDTAMNVLRTSSHATFCPWPSTSGAGYNFFMHALFSPEYFNATVVAIAVVFAVFVNLLLKRGSK